ncbi:hypothetical protein [Rhodovulum strictum]|uniref:Uncharacterized protein n=1 Tax=Rhodovulum strictum TaxID=58314 RepID=A0A844BKL2_9RHOB|nr:hypothetical protein [Rhodovulum strictum]MRH20527.1 hypothetical protein [Rhodovulum strictum]
MVGASKILTVSYGTFSCTLEGFEDSFGMMKAIAEYFRDLAAEDRYFGAEPPNPDAGMLKRIAEREIRSRVEARVGEDGIVLRPAVLSGADHPPVFAETSARADAHPAPPNHGTRAAEEPETVAAKLARIRAVVENARATAPAEYGAPFAGIEFEPDAPPTPWTEGHPGPKSPDPAAEAPDPSLAESAAELCADTVDDTAVDADSLAPVIVADGGPEPEAAATAEPGGGDAARARLLAALGRPVAAVPGTDAAPLRARARVLKLKREDLAVHWPAMSAQTASMPDKPPVPAKDEARLPDALEAELQAELAAVWAEFGSAPDAPPAESPVETDLPEAQETLPPPAIAAAPENTVDDVPDMPLATDGPLVLDRPLEPETAEALSPASPAEVHPDEPAPGETDAAQQDLLPPAAPTQVEIALQRLWDETNTKLDGVELTRRRASIAHFKAAVAATFADLKSGGGRSAGAEDEHARRPYRQVLAKVVRGNRDNTADTAADETPRLAPLILVSEQRVDMILPDPGKDTTAIRPRRVSAEDDLGGPQGMDPGRDSVTDLGFALYLAERETDGVEGMLVTAAAYLRTERGQEQFARPEVLRLAVGHLAPETSREELLNAFANLLRCGTFRKVRRGEYVLSVPAPEADTPEAELRHA